MRMWITGAIATAALLLGAAGPARAAFDVTAFEVTPSSTAAGAHADVTIATSFTPYNAGGRQPRNLTFHLPPGLAGDPFATPRCTEVDYRADKCPPATKVGTADATASVVALSLPLLRQTVTGDLYNLEPSGPEPARLGAVLRPTGDVLLGKLFVPTVITARSTDGGLDSVVTELPRTLPTTGELAQVYTERMAFTLQGRPAGGTGPFMRNPTSCNPATSTVEATPYGEPAATVTKTSSFTPTDCGALDFQPHIDGAVGARGQTAFRSKPPVRTLVSQGAEQAGQASVTVTLPGIISPDLTQLGRACPVAQVNARACPASARVGTVEAATPLLAKPLTGDVYLAQRAVGQFPGLTIQLGDPIPLRLDGAVELTPQGLKTTFTGLPDVPLARFQLDLAGGPSGAFQLSSDVCAAPKPPVITAAFTAQSGKQAAESKAMSVVGCTPVPRASARITRLRSGRPNVRITVTAADQAADLRAVRVLLPDALSVKPKRVGRGVRARAGSGALAGGAVKLTRDGELRLTLPEKAAHGHGDARQGSAARRAQAQARAQAPPNGPDRARHRRRRRAPGGEAQGPPAPRASRLGIDSARSCARKP